RTSFHEYLLVQTIYHKREVNPVGSTGSGLTIRANGAGGRIPQSISRAHPDPADGRPRRFGEPDASHPEACRPGDHVRGDVSGLRERRLRHYPQVAALFVPLWPALLAMVVSHGVSFFWNFLGRREYVGRTIKQQMTEPYQRMILLHITIIFGAWPVLLMGQPLPALLLLVVLKIVMD